MQAQYNITEKCWPAEERVLGVTATGENIATAISRAYEAVEKIQWDGIHYRKDIGHRVRIWLILI